VKVVRALRDRGLGVIEDFSGGSLKSCMKRADRLGARFVLILGTDELAEESVMLKDMATGTQERVAWSELGAEIAGRTTSG
jgi:histidyl-tRNA synthetase